MKTVGVTGGGGFIGSHVVRLLWERGYQVYTFDRKQHDNQPTSKCFLGDIRDPSGVNEFVAAIDGVIHLAGVLGTQETIQNPWPSVETNIRGGLNVLEAVARYKVPMVNIAVGNYFMDNSYAISKNTVERLVNMFNVDRGTSVVSVRAVNAYGPGQSVAAPFGSSKIRKIIPSFICRALTGQDVEVYGDGRQVSDMVFVEDVAQALVKTLEAAETYGPLKTIEVGPVKHNTVKEVAEAVIRLTNSTSKIVYLPMRPGETPGAIVTADSETLRTVGMNPDELTNLEVGLRQTIKYYEGARGKAWHEPIRT